MEAADQNKLDPGDENTELKNETPTEEEPSAEGKSPTAGDNIDKAEPTDVVTDERGAEKDEEEAEEVTPDDPGEAEGGNTATPQPAEGAGDEVPTGAKRPTSKTFDEGEGPEMTPLMEEPLSHEGSIMLEMKGNDDEDRPPQLHLGTTERGCSSPEQQGEEEKDREGPSPTEDAGPSVDYKEYRDQLHQLQAEREKLSQLNGQLQNKLVEYFRKKTGDDTRPEKEKAMSDQEQRYQKYLATMEDLKRQHQRYSEAAQMQAEELRLQTQEKLGQVDHEWRSFAALKHDVAVAALSRRLGKPAAQAEVEQIQAAEQRREKELVQARLENIKLKNKTRRLEATLSAKEELAAGLHLVDFEQLKIENQTYSDKIEERNEEMLKLRRKITGTVQVLTHVKEKLQFVQTENQAKWSQLAEAEAVVARKRDVLTRTKQARDGLRADNLRLRQRSGLLGNETLLRDFEEKADASDSLEERLEALKRRHAELTLKCAGVKRKLEQTKPVAQ